MALEGPARLAGDTDKISSGSERDGGRIATGLELSRAAQRLTTFINETIVKGLVPGITVAFRQTLKLWIIDSTLD